MSFERQYYEYDAFWNPSHTTLGELDHQRVRTIAAAVPTETVSMLDAGCGNGIFSNHVAATRPAIELVSLDRSFTALHYANGARVAGDLTHLPLRSRSFDCVTILEVLEHLPLPVYDLARAELARVTRQCLIVSVPNDQKLGNDATQCPECRTTFDPDLHMRSFNKQTMTNLFSDHGFRCQRVTEVGARHSYRWRNWRLLPKPSSKKMLSPICPVCGYTNDSYLQVPMTVHNSRERPGILRRSKDAINKVWPTMVSYRWLVGVYSPATTDARGDMMIW